MYVQPLRLLPTRDGVEKLVGYVRFLEAIRVLGLPVVASRVGAFGLVLAALDIPMFDSGLGFAESTDLAALTNSHRSKKARAPDAPAGSRRVYLEPLKTTLPSRAAEAILRNEAVRSRFTCDRGCCRWKRLEDLPSRSRQHYLWVRENEAEELARLPRGPLRIERVHKQLVEARDLASVVTRAHESEGNAAPEFAHLERWLAVLAVGDGARPDRGSGVAPSYSRRTRQRATIA